MLPDVVAEKREREKKRGRAVCGAVLFVGARDMMMAGVACVLDKSSAPDATWLYIIFPSAAPLLSWAGRGARRTRVDKAKSTKCSPPSALLLRYSVRVA